MLTILINIILMYSVNRIRNTIKSKEYIDPNEKFIFTHMINFFIASVLKLVQLGFLFEAFAKNAKWTHEEEKGDPNWQ